MQLVTMETDNMAKSSDRTVIGSCETTRHRKKQNETRKGKEPGSICIRMGCACVWKSTCNCINHLLKPSLINNNIQQWLIPLGYTLIKSHP